MRYWLNGEKANTSIFDGFLKLFASAAFQLLSRVSLCNADANAERSAMVLDKALRHTPCCV